MGTKAKVRWHEGANAWRSDVGPRGEHGRRTPVYFREIPNTERGRRAAQDALDDYLRDRDRNEALAVQDANNPRVGDGIILPYLQSILEKASNNERAMRTHDSHAERLDRFVQFVPDRGPYAGIRMGDRLALSLTDDDGAMLIASMKAKGLKGRKGNGPLRIIGVLRSVNAAFNWAASNVPGRVPKRILPANPFEGLKVDPPVRLDKRLPTRSEASAFFRAARKEVEAWTPFGKDSVRCSGCVRARKTGVVCRRLHSPRARHDRAVLTLCRLQVYAGARPDELCRATWGSVSIPGQGGVPGWEPKAWRDPKTGQWWGRITVYAKTTRATGELRRIAVPPVLARSILRLQALNLNDRWMFPRLSRTKKDGTIGDGHWDSTSLANKIRPWRRAAGLGDHFVLYALRHRMYTTAVHGAELTADRAGKVGGSSGQTVRKNYLHPAQASNFEAAARIFRAGKRDDPTWGGPPEPSEP